MTITSREFKQLIVDFGMDLELIGDGLYEAIEEEITAQEGATFAERARSKLADYSALLNDGRLDDLKKSQVAERYEDRVDVLRNLLRQYAAKEK